MAIESPSLDQARDTPRIRAAFAHLVKHAKHWPPPSLFIDALPPVIDEYKALPRPEATPGHVKAMLAEIAAKLGVP